MCHCAPVFACSFSASGKVVRSGHGTPEAQYVVSRGAAALSQNRARSAIVDAYVGFMRWSLFSVRRSMMMFAASVPVAGRCLCSPSAVVVHW